MNMNNIMKLATAALLCTACSTTAKVSTIPGMEMTTKLKRSDYIVLGTATGQACAQEECFFGSCNKTATVAGEELLDGRAQSENLRDVNTQQLDLGPLAFLLGTGNPGPTGNEIAEKIALYKAIESIPDADAILSPRFDGETSENSIPFFSRTVKSCVTVKGKAVRVKSDEEMKAGK
jgi:hypothetical protein